MLHRDNQEMPVEKILAPLNEEIVRGRVRAIGVSNWEYRRLEEAREYADKRGLPGFAVVSNNISLALPAAAFYRGLVSTDRAGEAWHLDTGIPLIPWSVPGARFLQRPLHAGAARRCGPGQGAGKWLRAQNARALLQRRESGAPATGPRTGGEKGGGTAPSRWPWPGCCTSPIPWCRWSGRARWRNWLPV